MDAKLNAKIESVTRLSSSRLAPEFLVYMKSRSSLSSPLCAGIMDLLNTSHLQVFHGVGRLAEMRGNRVLRLLCSDVGPVTVHPYMEGVLSLSNVL